MRRGCGSCHGPAVDERLARPAPRPNSTPTKAARRCGRAAKVPTRGGRRALVCVSWGQRSGEHPDPGTVGEATESRKPNPEASVAIAPMAAP